MRVSMNNMKVYRARPVNAGCFLELLTDEGPEQDMLYIIFSDPAISDEVHNYLASHTVVIGYVLEELMCNFTFFGEDYFAHKYKKVC